MSNKALQYREYAAKALAEATEIRDPEAKGILLEIGRQFDRLAELLERGDG